MDSQASADIFYHVKKEILDKLDLILQQLNLEIIKHRPKHDFNFIELAHFEYEISSFFSYLDRLYESLNASISGYNSISSIPSGPNIFQEEINKLRQEKQLLTSENKKLMQKLQQKNDNVHLMEECKKILNECKQLREEHKEIRTFLRGYKFSLLEDRVQIIAKLKQYGEEECQKQRNACKIHKTQTTQILNEINQILQLC